MEECGGNILDTYNGPASLRNGDVLGEAKRVWFDMKLLFVLQTLSGLELPSLYSGATSSTSP